MSKAARRRGLPGGVVTLLFSDIEGSTRLLQRLGEAYADVLETHRRIMRDSFQAHGGQEVGTEGDSFFVVFTDPSDAVAAALEAQQRLASHSWPYDLPVHVRMGIHTGEASVVNSDYVGLSVHKAARISAGAHGGQVVISADTRARLTGDIALIDLGEHRLKDFDEPVQTVLRAEPGDLSTAERLIWNSPPAPPASRVRPSRG